MATGSLVHMWENKSIMDSKAVWLEVKCADVIYLAQKKNDLRDFEKIVIDLRLP